MLDLVEIAFSRHGIQSLRYDGKMNREARETALSIFKKAGGPKVMLIRCNDMYWSLAFIAHNFFFFV